MSQINSLTKTQASKIPVYFDKWLNMPLKPMDKKIAFETIEELYELIDEKKPQIIIGQSPLQTALMVLLCSKIKEPLVLSKSKLGSQLRSQLWSQLWSQLRSQLGSQLGSQLRSQLESQLESQLWSQLRSQLGSQLESQLWSQLESQLGSQLWSQLESQLGSQLEEINNDWYLVTGWESFCSWIDYAKYIGVKFDNKKFETLTNLANEICFIIPYKGICFISEKPTEIHWRNKLLHKDGGMSVKYSDGWGIYSYDGVSMPEKYGSIKSELWESKWILEEKNAELRRVLIQGIGYGKISRDLNAKLVDSWKEYELLRIENADVEPIIMIKMICPSTGLIHAHRVPPDMDTARNAIKWVNHGIDKEEFLIER